MENSLISQSFNNSVSKNNPTNPNNTNQYQSQILGGERQAQERPRIMLNLMDIAFQEHNLSQILEVSLALSHS
jgi:hypothetical protein